MWPVGIEVEGGSLGVEAIMAYGKIEGIEQR